MRKKSRKGAWSPVKQSFRQVSNIYPNSKSRYIVLSFVAGSSSYLNFGTVCLPKSLKRSQANSEEGFLLQPYVLSTALNV